MTRKSLPDDLTRFVLTSIPSVPLLEAMLLLRNEPADEWDAKRLAKRLYISERAASQLLDEMHAAELIGIGNDAAPSYRYGPAAESVREIVDRLADAYAVNLVEITNLIHSGSAKKAQRFADAFRLRKDD
jgi:hypothetical protein